jgi:hypothetical protein
MFSLAAGCGVSPAALHSMSTAGLVKITAEPDSARVYVDGDAVGRARDFNGTPGLLRLSHGTHTIELKKDGYQSYTRRVFVGNQAVEPIDIMLIRDSD